MTTMTLTEFLLARIAEDEAAILEGWDSDGRALIATMWTGPEPGYTTVASGNADGDWVAHGREVDDPRHVRILFDPARVLADCEAKRRIIELHEYVKVRPGPTDKFDFGCWRCHYDRDYGVLTEGWCDTVRALALPYADHPDYREEWRP